ncbi:type 1 glutamine amidotransferase domain-containing protein [Massilia violaceinigra]|uniref:Type 1 glutamine amidotransferase domain-containing protein n=1 Tax=Massilia violaceinigra TaxID=2045208 RepID=A0A2D2DP83_9BURK|nr:type 1 glutamine amidotransferase domain-containing protein [Massilia violaceinigra]ATQ76791.1 type 1 glutamine amidotransferase domain-containing protein [Massilia violaceinigra]
MIKKLLRAGAWLAATLVLLAAGGYLYYRSLDLDQLPRANPQFAVADLAYLKNAVAQKRGRILAVVSSTERGGPAMKRAGYELTELARAYYVFQANGYEVDIASPKGGKPPERIDLDDMGDADYAFLNDAAAQAKVVNSIALAHVDARQYAAVYFVGGKGAMYDLPDNPDVARIVNEIAGRGVVGAVCHGPAALLGVKLASGKALVAGRRMTAFTNEEELFLTKDARTRFGFLLEERAVADGARFVAGPKYIDNTVVDGRLVTGQNAWSTWSVAEAMIAALGHRPVARERTAEEVSLRLLATYYRAGLGAARAEQAVLPRFDKMMVLMHSVVAAMQWRAIDAVNLQRLANG